jgi:hypothetical protein
MALKAKPKEVAVRAVKQAQNRLLRCLSDNSVVLDILVIGQGL